jgi:AmmeMemoRadiSam system protein A
MPKRVAGSGTMTVPALDAGARARLLALARSAVEAAARGEPLPVIDRPSLPPSLARPGAAFVTLHADGRLRGCIGSVAPRACSVAETVVEMARAASRDDPRFAPVTSDELATLVIEVSVLGVPEPVTTPDEVVVGRDGVIVEDGARRGLLLPQVATERQWDRETLLDQACVKAGLSRTAWRQGARILRFQADVFGEA